MVRAPYAGGAEGVCGHLKADRYANSDLAAGYENLVLFAQAGVAKNSILLMYSLTTCASHRTSVRLKYVRLTQKKSQYCV